MEEIVRELWEVVKELGPAGLFYMFVFIAGLVLKKWVLGWVYEERVKEIEQLRKERDDALDLAIFGIDSTEKTTAELMRRRRTS